MALATDIRMRTEERLSLAHALSSFQSLIVLDHAWTGIAPTIQQATNDDDAVLATLVSSILLDLDRARTGATWLQDFVVQTGIEELRSAARAAAQFLPDDIASVVQDVDDVYSDQ